MKNNTLSLDEVNRICHHKQHAINYTYLYKYLKGLILKFYKKKSSTYIFFFKISSYSNVLGAYEELTTAKL